MRKKDFYHIKKGILHRQKKDLLFKKKGQKKRKNKDFYLPETIESHENNCVEMSPRSMALRYLCKYLGLFIKWSPRDMFYGTLLVRKPIFYH